MKTVQQLLLYYGAGIVVALLGIGFIHLYAYIQASYFSYAGLDTIVFTATVSGVPFGVAVWAFWKFNSNK